MDPWEDVYASGSIDPGFSMDLPDEPIDPEFTVAGPSEDIDPGFTAGQPGKGILDGLPPPYAGSSLGLLLDPQDIATIPRLPAHVYENAGIRNLGDYADQRVQQDSGDPSGAQTRQPAGYVSNPNQVSLTPLDWPPPALGIGTDTAPSQPQPVPQWENSAAKAADATLFGTDAFNAGRQYVLEGRSGQYTQDMANHASGFAGDVRTVPFDNAELALGATKVLGGALAGAGVLSDYSKWKNNEISGGKFALDSAVASAPLLIGGLPVELGALAYQGVDTLYPGGWPGLASDNGRAYQKNVMNNPYYDPMLTAIP